MQPAIPVSATIARRISAAGLRPTRQRIMLGHFLFGSGEDRHITAEQLLRECKQARVHISLATIYNTLHQFTTAGMLRELVVDSSRVFFDTNTQPHHHFYCPHTGWLKDIPAGAIALPALPAAPDGMEIEQVEMIIRVKPPRKMR